MRLAVLAAIASVASLAPSSAHTEATERFDASATFVRFGVINYRLEVREQTPTEAQLDPDATEIARETTGTVDAWLELCDGTTCSIGQQWSGELGSGLTNGVAIERHPLLGTARLRGFLRDVETNAACYFDVRWTGDGAPEVAVDAVGARATRDAVVSVDASCWGTHSNDPAFDAGSGWTSWAAVGPR